MEERIATSERSSVRRAAAASWPIERQLAVLRVLSPHGSDWIELLDYPQVYLSSEGLLASSRSGSVRLLRCALHGKYLAYRPTPPERARYLHQLVCETFHGQPPSATHEVRHLDGNRFHNGANNLAWGTRAENAADRVRHGTDNSGSRNWNARLSSIAVSQIKAARAAGLPYAQIGRLFNVSTMTAYRAAKGISWRRS